jgi:hypothetical protein
MLAHLRTTTESEVRERGRREFRASLARAQSLRAVSRPGYIVTQESTFNGETFEDELPGREEQLRFLAEEDFAPGIDPDDEEQAERERAAAEYDGARGLRGNAP